MPPKTPSRLWCPNGLRTHRDFFIHSAAVVGFFSQEHLGPRRKVPIMSIHQLNWRLPSREKVTYPLRTHFWRWWFSRTSLWTVGYVSISWRVYRCMYIVYIASDLLRAFWSSAPSVLEENPFPRLELSESLIRTLSIFWVVPLPRSGDHKNVNHHL